jgi:hypothetical protein
MSSALRFSLAFVAVLSLVSSFEAIAADVTAPDAEKDIQAAIAELEPADRALAEAQRWCPVMPTVRLGAMGKPEKISLDGKAVLLCCAQCEKKARANSKATLAKVEKLKKATAAVAKLSPADRQLADAQRFCAVQAKSELGSMGTPVKVVLEGQPVFLCCAGCKKAATANPKATLAKLKERAKAEDDHQH